MPVQSIRIAAVLAALVALLTVAASAGAKPHPNPNLWLHVLPSPGTPLVGADVTVTDATGRVVGRGETNLTGTALLRVEKGKRVTRPYTVTTSGGTTDGKPFTGHLRLRTWRAAMRGGSHNVNMVTTAAVIYAERHGGRVADIERRIFKGLGMVERFGHIHLKHSSHMVDRRKVNRHHAANGGFDGSVEVLVEALEGTRPFPDHSTTRPERPRALAPATRQASGGSSVPCGITTAPASAQSNTVAVAVASVQMAAGLVSGFMTKDPSLFLNGVSGMAMSQTPGMTTSSMMLSIENQLACISGQIAALQKSVDTMSEQLAVNAAQSCESNIQTVWANDYLPVTSNAAAYPTDPEYGYFATNDMITVLHDDIQNQVKTCGNIINTALFNGNGGQVAAWTQLVKNYKSGNPRSNDSIALSQQSVVELQQFLQYWGNLMYQQTVLVNEWYNIEINFNGKKVQAGQLSALIPSAPAPACPAAAPSLDNVQPLATTGCQWQQNIADVWPGDVYTDEVLWWKKGSSAAGAIGGVAISAVPVAWGTSTTAWTNPANMITPYYLHDKEIDKYDKRWNAKNAVASFNAQPGTDIGGLNQSIYFRRAPSDYGVAPYCDGDCGKAFPSLSKYGPFFSSWLNAAKPAPVNGSYATVNLAPGSSKTADGWQQLATDGVVVFDDHSTCGYNGTGKSTVYAHYTSHNTIYSPSPWTANTGGTIGGGTPAEGTDPCSIKIPIAFLKGRTTTQGTTWPSAPVITSTGTVAVATNLVATGCPSGGCVWAISSDGAPAGLALSATGTFSWPGATSGQTASVQVVAGNNVAYSPPVTLTVRAP